MHLKLHLANVLVNVILLKRCGTCYVRKYANASSKSVINTTNINIMFPLIVTCSHMTGSQRSITLVKRFLLPPPQSRLALTLILLGKCGDIIPSSGNNQSTSEMDSFPIYNMHNIPIYNISMHLWTSFQVSVLSKDFCGCTQEELLPSFNISLIHF